MTDAGAVVEAAAVAGLADWVGVLAGAAGTAVARGLAGGVIWACAAWGTAKVRSRMLTAVATHTATAVSATATPGLARMLAQLTRLMACASAADQADSTLWSTRRR